MSEPRLIILWIFLGLLIYWFIARIFGTFRKPRRSTVRLHGDDDEGDIDEPIEVIDTSGGPIKPGHLRRTLRDPRLLPKNKDVAKLRAVARMKRRKVMTKGEAQRLFGGTQRTRDRGLRDLTADEEQLRRHNLPLWRTEEEVAKALGLTMKQLWFFATHRERDRHPHYVTFAVPKRSGGERLIMAPKRSLKRIQRLLCGQVVRHLPVSEHAHGFRGGRNVRTGAEAHVGRRHVLRIDLKDFFPSVTFARVRGYLIALGYSFPVASTLAVLMTEAERQPVQIDGSTFHVPVGERHCVQGAPTSPGLCNAIVGKLDHRLAGLARKHGLSYTRYADDLTFSGDLDRNGMLHFLKLARWIIHDEGFEPNNAKTRLASQGRRQVVTGAVVNETLGLSRKERRLMRAMKHRLEQQRKDGAMDETLLATLTGKLAWLNTLNPKQADKFRMRA